MFLTNILKWFPVLSIQWLCCGLLYGYVTILKRSSSPSNFLFGFAQILPFILLVCFQLCFVRTVASRPPKISDKYRISEDLIAADNLCAFSIYTRTKDNEPRYCKACGILQPDRSYHCPICEKCVLRMDHHCFWMNNCIHFGNVKFFILTQWYGALTCLAMAVVCVVLVAKEEIHEKDRIRQHFDYYVIIVASLALFLIQFALWMFYFSMVLQNQTHIERVRGIHTENGQRNDRLFDLGCQRNFSEIYGECLFCVCTPIFTSRGNGEVYMIRIKNSDSFTEGVCTTNIIVG